MNEGLSELKANSLSFSNRLAITEKAFFKVKLQKHAPKKEETAIPFVSTRYSIV